MSYHIQVCCRVRPNDRKSEINRQDNVNEDQEEEIIKVIPPDANSTDKSSAIININGKTNFSIDQVFEDCQQNEIFDQSLEPLLQDLFKGIHCTLFTYGQTGSGKTHTVIGGTGEERGLLPRAVEYIFDKVQQQDEANSSSSKSQFLSQQTIVKISFIEIYHEKLHDLLSVHYQPHKPPPPTSSVLSEDAHALAIRQATDGTIFVENLQEITIQSLEDFQKYLNIALKKRMMGSHRLNEYSSRSHLCCLIDLVQYQYPSQQQSGSSLPPTSRAPRKLHSKLSIIDLAGSEMARKTEATGQRFQEAKFINKSLSALSKVIGALAMRYEQQIGSTTTSSTSAGEGAHVPYRDSKLTRLLQNSLGGNSKTIIILTVSRKKDHLSETISTLKFGERARLIKVAPQVNSLLSATGALSSSQVAANAADAMRAKEFEDTITQLKDQILSLNQIINDLRNDQQLTSAASSSGENNNEDFKGDFSLHFNHQPSASLCQMCSRALEDGSELRRSHAKQRQFEDKEDEEQEDRNIDDAEEENEEGEEEEEEEEEEEVVERCAICGLNTEETMNLKDLTNEDLGFLFSCDGNCGNKFHIRCVGVVGEGGQFTLPEGEWFCNECTVQISEAAIQREKEEKLQQLKERQQTFTSPVKSLAPPLPPHPSTVSTTPSHEDDNDETADLTTNHLQQQAPASSLSIHQHPLSTSHYKEVLIYMNLITSLQQKFNLIRKERNRILNHFQNEKKLFTQLENLRNQKIETLVTKNLTLQEEKENLQDSIKQLKKQNKFLQHQLQQQEKQQQQQQQQLLQQQSHPTHALPTSSQQPSHLLLSSTTSNATGNVIATPMPTSASATDWVSFTDSQELQHVLHGLYLSTAEGGEDARETLRKSSSHPSSLSPRPSSSNSSSSQRGEEQHKRRKEDTTDMDRRSESNDENRSHESENVRRSSFLQHRKQLSQGILDGSALIVAHSNQDEEEDDDSYKIPKPWLKSTSSITSSSAPVSMKIPVKPALPSTSDRGSANIANDNSTAAGEPSRFVNPLKNRLSELLDLVEEEKHSFQEIRSQFQQQQQQHKKQLQQQQTRPH